MTIVRSARKHKYVVINNACLEDKRLSYKARGILAYLLTKPDHWTATIKHIEQNSDSDGRDACANALKELEAYGYLVREQPKDDQGKFSDGVSILYESPKTGFPLPDKASVVSTEISYNSPSESNSCRFTDFWQVYPRKENKKKAQGVWMKKKLDGLADTIINDVKKRHAKHASWIEGFVPHATTYLTGERWHDEIKEIKNNGNSKAVGESLSVRSRQSREAKRRNLERGADYSETH